jgi:two-component system, OmpR family, sensor histidine kinase QseC
VKTLTIFRWLVEPSLLRRTVLTVWVVLVVSWFVLMGWIFWTLEERESGDYDVGLMKLARTLDEMTAIAGGDDVVASRVGEGLDTVYKKYFNEFDTAEYRSAFQIYNRSGALVYASGTAPRERLTRVANGFADGTADGFEWRVAAVTNARTGMVSLAADRIDIQRKLRLLIIHEVLNQQLWMIPVVLVTAFLALRLGLRPLSALASQVAGKPLGDFTAVEPAVRYQELNPLVDALNAHLGRLQAAIARERQFLVDAAHELRTPLAAISTQGYALAHARDQRERDLTLTALEEGIARTASLTRQLLAIGRVDGGAAISDTRPVRFDVLVRDRVAAMSDIVLRRSIEIVVEAAEPVVVCGEPVLLASIVDNLVDNAGRYVQAGGRVEIALREYADDVVLTVRDNGPGVDDAFRDRLFERFYRVPGNEVIGSGLGLAIVRASATVVGGSAKLVTGLDGRGFGVEVRVPRDRMPKK